MSVYSMFSKDLYFQNDLCHCNHKTVNIQSLFLLLIFSSTYYFYVSLMLANGKKRVSG